MWSLDQERSNPEVRDRRISRVKHMLITRPVRVYRITIEIENGMSSTKRVEYAFIGTSRWAIKDVKFVDDDELVIAASDRGQHPHEQALHSRQC